MLLLISQLTFAQDKTITGKVTDSKDGSPVSRASVRVKGTGAGTTTADDGTFRLTLGQNVSSLIISSIGFENQEIDISGKTEVPVSLVASNSGLSEVVVIGYGTARRKDLTGSVATIKDKDFNKGVITSPDQLIQGKAAGVLVINNTGQPGGSTTVRIRGTSSIRSSNQPLFVIDGVPLSGGSARPGASGGDFGSDGGNPLNFINPNDIASMEILKDASATAIYGSRGANGVVIITTKRGQSGVPQLDITAATGVSNVLKKLKVLDGNEYRKALQDYGLTSGDYGQNEDAFDAITRSAVTQNYNLAVGGGNENARYRISAGYLDQQGVIETSELKKLTANITSSFKFLQSKKLGLDINVLVTQTNEDIAPVSNFVGFTGNVIGQALQWNPTIKLRANPDSFTVYPVGNTTINPVAALSYYKDKAIVNTIIASISPSYKITKELEYKFLYSVNRQTGVRKGMVNRLLNLDGIIDRGVAFIGNNEQTNSQITNTLNYNKQVSSALNVNAVIGHEWLVFNNRSNFVSAKDFDNFGLNYYDILQYSTSGNRTISSYVSPSAELQSFFARAIFNYKDKYLLTGTFRSDGSTKFGKNNRYGYFPSLGFAWNITNESFLRGSNVFNSLKLRLGWGKTGNQEFPSGASLNRFTLPSNGTVSRANWANPDLKWESSSTTNAGIDFSVLDNRLTGTIDYFYKKTTNVLFEQTLVQPGPSGKIWVNLDGYVLNKGVEISLYGAIIKGSDLNWNLGTNISFLQNTVNGLKGYYETGELRGQGFSDVRGQRITNGQPLNVWYLGVFEGIDKATGQSIYQGGDPGNKSYLGSPNPKTLLGISTDVSYKKFTVSINMNGTFGHYLFNNTAATVLGIGNLGNRNIAKSVLSDAGGAQEAISNAPAPTNRYLEKGNYVKLANATLSYRIGNINNVIRNLNISLTGQNLFVITKYTGFDPEVNTDGGYNGIPSIGIEYVPYPSARTVILGVNFSL
ncbi:MAG: SusC/RagA family TonB-linked outer membrane protein [Bacteroidota bacterium]